MTASLADQALRALGKYHQGDRDVSRRRVPATEGGAGQLGALEKADWEIVGLVCGAAVYHVGVVGWPQGNAEVTTLSSAMYAAREQALTGVRDQASTLEADGVIDTRLDIHFMADHRHLPRFVAIGTALRRRRPDEDRRNPASGPFVASVTTMELILLADAGYEPVGTVMGSCVYHVGRRGFSQWATGQTKNVEMSSYTAALYEAREIAMARLQEEALHTGADGVVGVTTAERSHIWGSHVIEFFAIGTAVRADTRSHRSAPPPLLLPLNDPVMTTDPGVIAHPPEERPSDSQS